MPFLAFKEIQVKQSTGNTEKEKKRRGSWIGNPRKAIRLLTRGKKFYNDNHLERPFLSRYNDFTSRLLRTQ